MATKTQPSPSPFSRLSRLGLGLGLKSSSPTTTYPRNAKKQDDDGDWYIAYNGPISVPKDHRKRDSWGDLVDEGEGTDILRDSSLIRRYGGGHDLGSTSDWGRGRASTVSRYSGTTSSGGTEPSRKSVRLPNRRSYGNGKRGPGPVSTFINLDAAGGVGESPMPSLRSPITPASPGSNAGNRSSLASLFFGPPSANSKKSFNSPSTANLVDSRRGSRVLSPVAHTRKSTSLDIARPEQGPFMAIGAKSPTTGGDQDDYYNSYYSTLITTPPLDKPPQHLKSQAMRLVDPPIRKTAVVTGRQPNGSTSTSVKAVPNLSHPYAYAFPTKQGSSSTSEPIHASRSDPSLLTRAAKSQVQIQTQTQTRTRESKHIVIDSVSSGSQHQPNNSNKTIGLGINAPAPVASGSRSHTNILNVPSTSGLKASVSTPNLRQQDQDPPTTTAATALPTGVERWLSAETWCDAIVFPRPRFKVKSFGNGNGNGEASVGGGGSEKHSHGNRSARNSARIVSPPPTPIERSRVEGRGEYMSERGGPAPVPAASASASASLPTPVPASISRTPSQKPHRKLTKSKSAASLRSLVAAEAEASASFIPIVNGDDKGKNAEKRLRKRRPSDLVLDPNSLKHEASLDQVLDEGDQLEEERKQWQAAAAGSFGNKHTRQLSRVRAKSLSHKDSKRNRKESDSRAMANIDFLAARTLLGNQGIAPTITTHGRTRSRSRKRTSDGLTATATISSKTHTQTHSNAQSDLTQPSVSVATRGGHGRNDSWGQSALKLAKSTATGAICGHDQASNNPMDEKMLAVENAIMSNETKIVRIQGDIQEEDGFVMLESHGELSSAAGLAATALGPGGSTGVSPAPSGATGTGVGVAISTPIGPDDSPQTYESISFPDHPYGQYAVYPHRVGTSIPSHSNSDHGHGDVVVRGSDFAGPHPSSPKMADMALASGANDVSARHRLPPKANNMQPLPHIAHPYAMGFYPVELSTPAPPTGDRPPSPPLDNHIRPHVGSAIHAYARVSTGDPEKLGMEEALTLTHGQGRGDRAARVIEHAYQIDRPEPLNSRVSNSQTWPPRVHRKAVPYFDFEESPDVSQDIVADMPSSADKPDLKRGVSSSDIGNSSGSSPQLSPRPLGNVDDLDHFHDLFYKPAPPQAGPSEPIESHKAVTSGASTDILPWDVSSSRSARSGLSSLARKLTEEYVERPPQDHNDAESFASFQRRGQRPMNISVDRDLVLSDLSVPQNASPKSMDSGTIPVHAGDSLIALEDDMHEDIPSSRGSSILEPHDDDTFGFPLRFGSVEAVSTPPAIVYDHDAFAHKSYIADKIETHHEEEAESPWGTSGDSLSPPSGPSDLLRSSLLSSTTEESRMSNLSDFPTPPVQTLTPAHMSIIHSYFGTDTPRNQVEDPMAAEDSRTLQTRPSIIRLRTYGELESNPPSEN